MEITDVNRAYMQEGRLFVEMLGRGFAWLDTGTHESLTEASQFVQILEQRQGLRVSCPEEVALRLGHITLDAFQRLAVAASKSRYGLYLLGVHRAVAAERERLEVDGD
jgi:glucose-1-phosphate thymidylyltransferase